MLSLWGGGDERVRHSVSGVVEEIFGLGRKLYITVSFALQTAYRITLGVSLSTLGLADEGASHNAGSVTVDIGCGGMARYQR